MLEYILVSFGVSRETLLQVIDQKGEVKVVGCAMPSMCKKRGITPPPPTPGYVAGHLFIVWNICVGPVWIFIREWV